MSTCIFTVRSGDNFMNVRTGSKKERVPRLVRMHADEMEDIDEVRYDAASSCIYVDTVSHAYILRHAFRSGEIAALFGVDCNSGDTFTTGTRCTLTSMFVPPAVVSLAINMSKVISVAGGAKSNSIRAT